MSIAQLTHVRKTYLMGDVQVHALRDVTLSFAPGDYCAIMGPSGSGKSTLLNLLGCLDRPTSGQYLLAGQDVSSLSDDDLSEIRCSRLGFIFQSYNLIAQLSVAENIEVPLFYQGLPRHQRRRRALELAEMVGLTDRVAHRPSELSGGQQQRVAIARSLANDPLMLLADEPTGNLDSSTGEEVLGVLNDLNRAGKTILVVTHDPAVARHARRVVKLGDGLVVSDT
ncbi:MAG: ABC transporter ATP-binding protein [Planctomycetes bacterium]|nr:ABC transporter ATP-binding protein [Planctomycetota bacterium]MBM4084148.1 ABC transporter ATP-binding protein [Planctomycetota bacterium]